MEEKYKKAFITALSLSEDKNLVELKYNDIDEWDSIGHMTLISELEETFNISFDTDDIVDFEIYKERKKILSKLGVNF